jgi:hypothetical protein
MRKVKRVSQGLPDPRLLFATTKPPATFGVGIKLAVAVPKVGEPQENPRWIHVANEGNYDGYPGGGVAITRQTLEQIVKNFKADPRFKLGGNSLGEGKVVPFDFAHVSEMDPRIGDPAKNELAPAWAMDVQVRNGDDGRAQLWVWTLLGDDVKGMIEKGEITYVSIAYAPQATHPVTGESIGALMTSVAFTNKPFIRDLTPLAASDFAADLLANMRANPGFVDVVEAMVRASKAPKTESPTMELSKRLAKLFSINLATEGAEDAIVAEADASVKLKREIADVLKATGFSDLAELVKKIPELLKAQKDFAKLSTDLDVALKKLSGFEAQADEAEVAAAMSVHKIPENCQPLMLSFLKSNREEFAKKYPIPDAQRAHLLSTFAAGNGGAQVTTPKIVDGKPLEIEPRVDGDETKIDLRSFTGNPAQKVIAHLKKQDPDFGKLPWNEQVSRAGTFRQQNAHRLVLA